MQCLRVFERAAAEPSDVRSGSCKRACSLKGRRAQSPGEALGLQRSGALEGLATQTPIDSATNLMQVARDQGEPCRPTRCRFADSARKRKATCRSKQHIDPSCPDVYFASLWERQKSRENRLNSHAASELVVKARIKCKIFDRALRRV